jgi:hypothetical protein
MSLRARLRAELEDIVDPASNAAIGAVLLQAIGAIVRGGPFDRVLACFFTADRMQLVARTGLGDGVEALIAKFEFPVSVRGGPVVAITQQRQATYLPADRSFTQAELRWVQQSAFRSSASSHSSCSAGGRMPVLRSHAGHRCPIGLPYASRKSMPISWWTPLADVAAGSGKRHGEAGTEGGRRASLYRCATPRMPRSRQDVPAS